MRWTQEGYHAEVGKGTYLFEACGSEAVDAKHERRGTNECGGHEKDMVVNLWDSA